MNADPLTALFAQYLAGGTPKRIEPVQLGPGPVFGPGAQLPESDGGASGFEAFAGGLVDYLNRDTEEDEGSSEPTGSGQTPATGYVPGGGGDFGPPKLPAPPAQPSPAQATAMGQGGGQGGIPQSPPPSPGGQTPATGYVPTGRSMSMDSVVSQMPQYAQAMWNRLTPAEKRAYVRNFRRA